LRPFYTVLEEHQRLLSRLTDRRALPRLKKLYEEAHDTVARKLRTRLSPALKDTFTTHQQRIVLAQLKQGQLHIAGALAGELSDVTKEAQIDSVRGLARNIAKLEKHFTGAEITIPIDEAWKLHSLVGKRRAALDTMHQRSIARWGARLFNTVHESTSMALATSATTEEAIELIPKAAADEWWQGERIVRTETAWAGNLSISDGIKESAEILPDLMKRWTEHVDDNSGQPLDDRVAPDSLAMHGQITDADGEFDFPDDAEDMTPQAIASMKARGPWTAPPNRPNDRASIQPWRESWNIPAYRLVGGGRVWV
jgi:hypothetical protein